MSYLSNIILLGGPIHNNSAAFNKLVSNQHDLEVIVYFYFIKENFINALKSHTKKPKSWSGYHYAYCLVPLQQSHWQQSGTGETNLNISGKP